MSDPLAIVPIRRSRISQQIVVQLCQMIRQGQLRPGDRLPPERELSEQLKVSRASLREALRALEIAGIVAAKQGGGTYIREVFEDEILSPLSLVLDASTDLVGDLWEVRSIFEPAVASRAAIRAQAADIAVLERIVEQQHGFLDRDAANDDWLESDRAFHVAVARASHNEVSVRVIRLINELLHEGRRHFATRSDRREHAYTWHREIAARIRACEPQQARDAMMQHLREVEEVIVSEVIAPITGDQAELEETMTSPNPTAAS
ncbi:MAG TPA: FadR/GntR family transcriptional regulator [Thermomicrobiales bacterium]|nr:FadR/GntR family transcriptional regulator [Thermomicrobiales bacterium]